MTAEATSLDRGNVATRLTDPSAAARIPGDAGIWVLIAGELAVFTLFFFLFSHARAQDPVTFAAAHLTLNPELGLANTVLLLTGSLFVAIGVHRVKAGRLGSQTFIRLGMACGLSFAALKVMEYADKVEAGITLSTNDFFMYYFALTGIHLFHVVLGLGFLSWAQTAVKMPLSATRLTFVEGAGLFWHLVDLLWIVLFALFYLLGAR
ncbi:MAG: cytochrome c oxidase subunit 3 [Novosphingobium sp.]|nr:cytochrome c oxidase subunit 3 [Novosphingobium sp.]